MACNMRASRHYLGALLVAAQLARLHEWRLAIRECCATCIYPFRAALRKVGWRAVVRTGATVGRSSPVTGAVKTTNNVVDPK
jgi:hypothetical protein